MRVILFLCSRFSSFCKCHIRKLRFSHLFFMTLRQGAYQTIFYYVFKYNKSEQFLAMPITRWVSAPWQPHQAHNDSPSAALHDGVLCIPGHSAIVPSYFSLAGTVPKFVFFSRHPRKCVINLWYQVLEIHHAMADISIAHITPGVVHANVGQKRLNCNIYHNFKYFFCLASYFWRYFYAMGPISEINRPNVPSYISNPNQVSHRFP